MAATKHGPATGTQATPSATVHKPSRRLPPCPLWSLLALLLVPLLACGFGAQPAQPAQDAAPAENVTSENVTSENAYSGNVAVRAQFDGESALPPLYLTGGAGLQPGTLRRITLGARGTTATGTVITPQQSPRLQAVWAQPHLAFRSMLLAESGDYFRLNPGYVAPNSRLHTSCDQNRLELRALGTVAPIFTTTTRSGACAPVWSADSTRFAFATPDGVAVYAVDQDELTALPAAATGIPWTWSPNGAQLLVQVEDALRLYARDGTYTTLSIRVDNLQAAHWSPDGTRIFLLDGRGAPVDTNAGRNAGRIGAVLAYDLERGGLDTLLDADRLQGTLAMAPAPDGSAVAAWYVDCRRVLSEFVPVLVLECEAELRLLAVEENDAWSVRTLLPEPDGAPIVARSQSVPEIVWADWRRPVDAAPLEFPESPVAGSTSDAPPALPAPDLDATPGTSPWVPVSLGETATASDYRYRVHDVLRGDAASALIYDAAVTSDVAVPAPGYEHLAARLEIAHTAGETVELGMVFFPRLYGSNWVGTRHLYLIDAATGRERRTFTADGSLEIWVAFLIARDETAPVLRLTHVSNLRAPFYMALSDAGGLPDTPILTPQTPNTAGLTAPASPGTPVITRDWQIEMLDLVQRTSDDGVTFAARLRIGYQGPEREFCEEVAFAGLAPVELYTPRLDSILGTPRLGLSCFLPGGAFETLLVFTAPPNVTSSDKTPSDETPSDETPSDEIAPAFYFHVPDAGSGPLRYFTLVPEDAAPSAGAPQLPAAPDAPPSAQDADAPPSAQDAIENSRAQRQRLGAAVEHEFVRYAVAQTVRGAAALRQVRAAASSNQTLAPGTEYVLVELVVENLAESQAPVPAHEIGLTGGAGVLYRRQFVAGIGPSVPTQLAPGEQARGWLGFVVAADQPGLVLVIPAPFDADLRASQYLALTADAGAATLAAQTTLPDPVVPNAAGLSLDEAATPDATIITTRWQLEIVDTRRGDAAWELVQAANPNNEPPPPGYEYMLARVRLRLLAAPATTAVNVTGLFLLDVVDADGTSAPSQVTVAPLPRLDATLFAGGQIEGWFVDLAPVETPVFLEFEDHSSEDAPRYVALQ